MTELPHADASPPRVDDEADVDDVTRALLTASRLLVAVSARSLAAAEDKVTLAQFRMLVVLATRGAAKLVVLAEALGVNPSTAMRMVDRLIAVGLADRRPNPENRRETILTVTPHGAAARGRGHGPAQGRDRGHRRAHRSRPAGRSGRRAYRVQRRSARPTVRDGDGSLFPLGWSEPVQRRSDG